MQTFVPYMTFDDSALVLDQKRLGKQRVETLQIMTALLTGRGWVHHPATNMWRGYERSLLDYQDAICEEWVRRGYVDTCMRKTFRIFRQHVPFSRRIIDPPWLGWMDLHISHQSNLVRKFPEYYGLRFPYTPDNLEYIWPA